ncbi:MAG: hypothetical protein ACRDGM_09925 [bacterium]
MMRKDLTYAVSAALERHVYGRACRCDVIVIYQKDDGTWQHATVEVR